MKAAKAVVAAVGLLVTVLTAALADDIISMSETTTLITTVIEAGVTVYAVWQIRNKTNAEV